MAFVDYIFVVNSYSYEILCGVRMQNKHWQDSVGKGRNKLSWHEWENLSMGIPMWDPHQARLISWELMQFCGLGEFDVFDVLQIGAEPS